MIEYGLIPLTIETHSLDNNITEGNFYVPNGVVVYDAKITSYSRDYWTDLASIYYQDGWINFYNLSEYGDNYTLFGDPYTINIPLSLIKEGDNLIRVSTGIDPNNGTGGSPSNKIIYKIGVPIDINYTGVFEKSEGCIWKIYFEDESNISVKIPSNYSKTNICYYNESTVCNNDFDDDAINNALCHLFNQLDFDNDGKLFVKFGQGDMDVEAYTVSKIPYMWGPTTVEVRVWK